MNNWDKDELGGEKLVIANTAQGDFYCEGKVVGFTDAPHYLIDTGDGVKWWRVDLCEIAKGRRRDLVYHSMKNQEIERLKRRLEFALSTGGRDLEGA